MSAPDLDAAARRVREALEGHDLPISDGLVSIVAGAATRGLTDDTALRASRADTRKAKAAVKDAEAVAYQNGLNARADQLRQVDGSLQALAEVRGFLAHVRAWEGPETARDDLLERVDSFIAGITGPPSSS